MANRLFSHISASWSDNFTCVPSCRPAFKNPHGQGGASRLSSCQIMATVNGSPISVDELPTFYELVSGVQLTQEAHRECTGLPWFHQMLNFIRVSVAISVLLLYEYCERLQIFKGILVTGTCASSYSRSRSTRYYHLCLLSRRLTLFRLNIFGYHLLFGCPAIGCWNKRHRDNVGSHPLHYTYSCGFPRRLYSR